MTTYFEAKQVEIEAATKLLAAEIDLESLKIHAQIVETCGKAEVQEAKFVFANASTPAVTGTWGHSPLDNRRVWTLLAGQAVFYVFYCKRNGRYGIIIADMRASVVA